MGKGRHLNEKYFSKGLILGLVIVSIAVPADGQERGTGRMGSGTDDEPYFVPRTESRIQIDGVLDEKAWEEALRLELPWEVSPGENVPPPVRSEVLLIHDDTYFYAAFRCYDPDPSAIRAHLFDRDNLGDDDYVGIVLDTFNDERRCFTLLTNPFGVQRDLIEAESGGDNPRDPSWDAIWNSAGQITEWGYTVEIAVPFNQLRFQRSTGTQIWGFDGVRYYPRSQNHLMGVFPRDRSNNIYLSQALKIEGFEGARPGHQIELFPTVTGVRTDARDQMPDGELAREHQDAEIGLTSSWGITPNMTLIGALNPDFSQVEADAQQLDINQPFALYYPERRPFFVEGADFFRTLKSVIYTRTVRDPEWGLKLTGKEGNNTVGAYAVRDDLTNLIFPGSQGSSSTSMPIESTAAVMRYKRDLGRRYTVGALATGREGTGYSNRVLGIDGDFRLSRTDQVQLQLMRSTTVYPDSIADSFGQKRGDFNGNFIAFEYDHESRSAGWWLDYDLADADFRADLGFIPMVDYQNVEAGWNYTWNPGPENWWSLLKVGGEFNYYEDGDSGLLNRGASLWGYYVGPVQSFVFGEGSRSRQVYGGSEYDLTDVELNAGIRPLGNLRLGILLRFGDLIDYANNRPGDRFLISPFVDWNVGSHLRLVLRHNYEKLTVSGGRLYAANISQLRAVYQFNVRTLFRAILQYVNYDRNTGLYAFPIDPKYENLFSQLLFSYEVNPRTVLYIGYGDNYRGNQNFNLTQQNRTLFMKLGYALMF